MRPIEKAKTLLDEAVRIGEQHAARAIELDLKMRRVKWRIYRARHLLRTGRPERAMTALSDLLAEEFTTPR